MAIFSDTVEKTIEVFMEDFYWGVPSKIVWKT